MVFNLADVLNEFQIDLSELEAKGLELDSRKVKPGDVFVAVIGHQLDGRKFIDDAIEKGAAAVLAETESAPQHGVIEYNNSIPVISFYQLNSKLSELAGLAFDMPSHAMNLIGVTGTNGKTSVTQIIATLLATLDQKCGVIGTTGQGVWPNLTETINTTPDAIGIQAEFCHQLDNQASWSAMEVSSHGLEQGRVEKVSYDVGVFTNLSRDHLDYHHTMEAYADAKFRLFELPSIKAAVLNMDDQVGREFCQRLGNRQVKVVGYSTDDNFNAQGDFLCAKNISLIADGTRFDLESSWGKTSLTVKLLGRFNIANLLASIGALLAQGVAFDALVKACEKLKPVAGRMETFSAPGKATSVVDYAHTPDGLEHALSALRAHCEGELYCIFGCGGDRDKGKRPMMGEIAERLSDKPIVTNDNPRSEVPEAIVEDILAGCVHPERMQVALDRRSAIELALEQASENDLILIAGKGHETYQVINGENIPYDERRLVANLYGSPLL